MIFCRMTHSRQAQFITFEDIWILLEIDQICLIEVVPPILYTNSAQSQNSDGFMLDKLMYRHYSSGVLKLSVYDCTMIYHNTQLQTEKWLEVQERATWIQERLQ